MFFLKLNSDIHQILQYFGKEMKLKCYGPEIPIVKKDNGLDVSDLHEKLYSGPFII